MDRKRHVAVWLRMLATKEIGAARSAKNLLKAQGIKIKNAYEQGGEIAAIQSVRQGQNDWVRVLVSIYTNTAKEFGEYLNGQLGLKKKKAKFSDAVQSYVAQNAYKKSLYITANSHDIVKKVISKGFSEGVGEAVIAKNLREQFSEEVGSARARTIARTEVHNAASFGMQAAAEDSDINMTREWVSVNDERTREDHADADGQERGMDEPFDVGGEQLDYPGDGSAENAINCRCTLTYTPINTSFAGGGGEGDFISGD
jgi:SPP1 gp7 family putative phage head morphogenesis protein